MVSVSKDSPCIALCSTALGDPVCRGCGRTFHEVATWCVMDEHEKRHTWERLPERLRLVEVGLRMNVLIDIAQDEHGVEWARIVGEETARPQFRLQRAAIGLGLQIKTITGEVGEFKLLDGVAASAEAFARLFETAEKECSLS